MTEIKAVEQRKCGLSRSRKGAVFAIFVLVVSAWLVPATARATTFLDAEQKYSHSNDQPDSEAQFFVPMVGTVTLFMPLLLALVLEIVARRRRT